MIFITYSWGSQIREVTLGWTCVLDVETLQNVAG